jgi:hypothetical protein
MDEESYSGEIVMLDDAFAEAIVGVQYTEDGNPEITYNGPLLLELHMSFGFSEQEAYDEIDDWRGSEINVLWPVNLVVKPDRPNLTVVPNNKDLH